MPFKFIFRSSLSVYTHFQFIFLANQGCCPLRNAQCLICSFCPSFYLYPSSFTAIFIRFIPKSMLSSGSRSSTSCFSLQDPECIFTCSFKSLYFSCSDIRYFCFSYSLCIDDYCIDCTLAVRGNKVLFPCDVVIMKNFDLRPNKKDKFIIHFLNFITSFIESLHFNLLSLS